jgi:3'(2'), 5'-bisphosphate nucleotidase
MSEPPAKTRIIGRDQAAALMDSLTDLVVKAGAAILGVNRHAMKVEGKLDGSPVTEADLVADRIIADGLARIASDVPALSEERVHAVQPPCRGSFFLVDPLDGTKEFVAGRDEYTVNIALVTEGVPLLGIIGAPAFGWLWRGLVGRGAERLSLSETGLGPPEPIHTRRLPKRGEPWIAAVSRSHGDANTEAFIDARPGAVRARLGSAVKFGRLAEGAADIYPRLGPTSEWDVAAGCAIVIAAGGKVTDTDGRALRFGERTDGFIMPAFIAWGDPSASP